MKKCGRCQIEKSATEFNKNRSTKSGLQDYCRDCQKQAKKKWIEKNPGIVSELAKKYRSKDPEKYRARSRQWRKDNPEKSMSIDLKRKYGITYDHWKVMFDQQEGKCLVCNKHQNELNQKLAVDHDHKTNQIRGLICCQCNRGIGYLQDDPILLRKAALYLDKFTHS